MKLLKFTALFFFDLAAFFGAVYDILDERREMRKLAHTLEDCKKYAELENYSPTEFETRMSNDEWADAVIEELLRKANSHE